MRGNRAAVIVASVALALCACKARVPVEAACAAGPDAAGPAAAADVPRLILCDVKAPPETQVYLEVPDGPRLGDIWTDASGAGRITVYAHSLQDPAVMLVGINPKFKESRKRLTLPEELIYTVETRDSGQSLTFVVHACPRCSATLGGVEMARAEDGTLRRTLAFGDLAPEQLRDMEIKADLVVTADGRRSAPDPQYGRFSSEMTELLSKQLGTPGTALEWAAPLQRGAGPRPGLLVGGGDYSRTITGINGLKRVGDAEIIVLREEGSSSIESCGPYGYMYTYVQRMRSFAKLEAFEAKTGKSLGKQTINGGMPRYCRETEMIQTWNGMPTGGSIYGDDPPPQKITDWIAGLKL